MSTFTQRYIELIMKLMEESHHLMLRGVSLRFNSYVLQRKLCTLKEFIKYGVPDFLSLIFSFLAGQH